MTSLDIAGYRREAPAAAGCPPGSPPLCNIHYKIEIYGNLTKVSTVLAFPTSVGNAPASTHERSQWCPGKREYQAGEPGDIVQVDTLDVRPLPGVALKQFTARDMISRWDVIEARPRATATMAVEFFNSMRRRFPFPIRAIQVDGGSEFKADFESARRESVIKLFVLPPRSPKLNGHVERTQRTHTEEFCEVYDGELEIISLNRALLEWERVYDYLRPHQSQDDCKVPSPLVGEGK